MKVLIPAEIAMVTGAGASYANGIYTVTNDGYYLQGDLKMEADRVTIVSTGQVLYDGTQCGFCYDGIYFLIAPVKGGHSYIPWDYCSNL